MFDKGQVYKRSDLHKQYGGQEQGGISTPSQHPFIMIFTAETGSSYGYKDFWMRENVFHYTGEGQVGDMQFVRGNRAIRDHIADGKDIHLFEYVRPGYVEYVGQLVYTGHYFRQTTDMHGDQRSAIVFELKLLE